MSDVRFVLTRYKGKILSYGIDVTSNRLISINFYENQDADSTNIGDIYVAKVNNILTNIKSAFIDYQKGSSGFKHGYLPFNKDNVPIVVNRTYDGRLKCGDEVIVQLSKEAVRTKEPVFTFKLSSKYMDGNSESQKADKLNEIIENGRHRTCYSKIFKAPAPYLSDLRNMRAADFDLIISDDATLFAELGEYVRQYMPEYESRLKFHEDASYGPNKLYSIETKLENLFCKKVWLKSGAYLVIEKTEAMYVIDVNSGKNISKKASDDYIYSVNLEAAGEIMYQIRLRNLTGIIVIDFINMEKDEDIEALLDEIAFMASCDPIKTKVVDMTPLGLVELTRMKNKKSLMDQRTDTDR